MKWKAYKKNKRTKVNNYTTLHACGTKNDHFEKRDTGKRPNVLARNASWPDNPSSDLKFVKNLHNRIFWPKILHDKSA